MDKLILQQVELLLAQRNARLYGIDCSNNLAVLNSILLWSQELTLDPECEYSLEKEVEEYSGSINKTCTAIDPDATEIIDCDIDIEVIGVSCTSPDIDIIK